jgi:hypothetical protein
MQGMLQTAQAMYTAENASLSVSSAQTTGLPLIAVTLAVGLAVGCVLYLSSRWLRRRTNRVLNLGVVAALIAVAASMIWLGAAYATGRGDLLTAQTVGSAPVEALAQVSIAAQVAHSDESLTLIDNSGDDSYQQDFVAKQQLLGPGPGTYITAAAAEGGPGAGQARQLAADARAWFLAHAAARTLDDGGHHTAAVNSVLGTNSGDAGSRYALLAAAVSGAIAVDQQAFDTHASASAHAFDLLEPGVIVLALLMAAGCAWGLNRRLAEYR